MSLSPIASAELRLEAPFYSPEALAACGLADPICVGAFDDDQIAAAINAALRRTVGEIISGSDNG